MVNIDVKLILSNNCNLNCKYCFVNTLDKQEMNKDIIVNILDFIKTNISANHINFDLFGGEPLLYLDLVLFCSFEIKKRFKNYSISITSNGIFLDQNILSKLYDNNIHLAISIDGPEEMSVMRFNKIDYERVMFAIDLCKQNKTKYVISCTLGKHNIYDPKKLVDFLKNTSADKISFNFIIGDVNNPAYVKPKYFAKQLVKIYNLLLDYNLKETSMINFKYSLINKIESYCSACGNRFVFNYNGNIFSCQAALHLDEFKIGNIYDGLNSNYFKFKNRTISSFRSCSKCDCKHLCRGGCLYNTFIINKNLQPCKENCLFFKTLYTELNKIYE